MKREIPGTLTLNSDLKIFFRDALRIAIYNPKQAISFISTLSWLGKAARKRSRWKKQGILVPPIIIFSITKECNLECKGCYAKAIPFKTTEELSIHKIKDIIDEAEYLGVSFFVIAGGEPLLRQDFFNITKEFPKIIFLIFTNGLLIDHNFISLLKRQRNVIPLISLEGNSEETDERRGYGIYEKLSSILNNLKSNGIFFGLSLTLTRSTFDILINRNFTERMNESGCRFFLYLEYTPIASGTEDWILTPSQREKVIDVLQKYRKEYKALFIAVPWDEMNVGGCLSAGRGFIHINAVGDVEPCPFAPFSDTNVRDSSLKVAMQSTLLAKIRNIPKLAIENGEGCILWKERNLVKSLLANDSN